ELWLRPSAAARGHVSLEDYGLDVQVLADLAEEVVLAPAELQLDRRGQLVPIEVATNRLITSPIRQHDFRTVMKGSVRKKRLEILPSLGQGTECPAIEGILPANTRSADM